MMLNKHVLGAMAFLCSASVLANIPIESRGLSQDSLAYAQNNTAAAISAGDASAAQVPTNLNWQLMQKNQQLENDIRTLRGKLEEQDNEIEKLKSELSNRYADLDQRLELLQQKLDPSTADGAAEDNQQDTSPSSPAAGTVTAPADAPPSASAAQQTVVAGAKPSSAELDKGQPIRLP